MGVIIDEFEVRLSIAPLKLFKTFILDINNFLPKVLPSITSYTNLDGDGGIGTTKLVTFVEGGEVHTTKHRIEEIDETKCVYKYTVFEGDIVDEDIEYFTNTVKMEEDSNGGCVYTYTSEIHTKGDDKHKDKTQEKIKQRRERTKAITHAIDAYLLAHPHH